MKFESSFGLGEIVIRESHQNGAMVQERMMEVVGIHFGKSSEGGTVEAGYICECAKTGNRQMYAEHMLAGDKDFNQDAGEYPEDILMTNRTP